MENHPSWTHQLYARVSAGGGGTGGRGEETLPERQPSAGTDAGRAAAKQSTLSIDSRLFRKRPLADFTDWVSGHRTLAERARSTAGRPADTRYTLLAATPCHRRSRWILPPRPTGRT